MTETELLLRKALGAVELLQKIRCHPRRHDLDREWLTDADNVIDYWAEHRTASRIKTLLADLANPPAARPTNDELWEQTLCERDRYHKWADKLAEAIGSHFNSEIGEHSNQNFPWAEALKIIEANTDAVGAFAASAHPPASSAITLLAECKRFLEDMHSMPVDWTIAESQLLHHKLTLFLDAAHPPAAPATWISEATRDLLGVGNNVVQTYPIEVSQHRHAKFTVPLYAHPPAQDTQPSFETLRKSETAWRGRIAELENEVWYWKQQAVAAQDTQDIAAYKTANAELHRRVAQLEVELFQHEQDTQDAKEPK